MDIDRYRLRPDHPTETSHPAAVAPRKTTRKFICGPIYLDWLEAVLAIPGRAPLVLALGLCYRAGLEKSKTVRLTTKLAKQFQLPQRTVYDALAKLEAGGLVEVQRGQGKCRQVTIRDEGMRQRESANTSSPLPVER